LEAVNKPGGAVAGASHIDTLFFIWGISLPLKTVSEGRIYTQ
jgi:hypothetical protein